MKKVKCSGPGCEGRRRHHESDEPRGPQWVEVPDGFPDDKKAYCSVECASYDGALAKRKVEKWIGYHVLMPDKASSYPEAPVPTLGGWVDETIRWKDFIDGFDYEARPYLEAVRKDATERGIRITGEQHQYCPEGVPLFDDGTVLKLSFRAWGDLMAAIWAEHDGKGYSYMDFYM